MLFNSIEFLYFLAVVFVAYYLPVPSHWRKAYQVTFMLVASALFYGWEDPRLLTLLFISCIGNSICCVLILKHKLMGNDRKIHVWIRNAVIINLLLLGSFKYAGFFADMIPWLPDNWKDWLKTIPLPIGISFYTFHGISMIVDVAKGHVQTSEAGELRPQYGKAGFAKVTRDVGFTCSSFPS